MFAKTLASPLKYLAKNRRRKNRPSLQGRGNRRFEQLEPRTVLSAAGWVTQVASPTDVGIVDLVTDAEGNIYVSGGFEGTVDFAPNENVAGDTLTSTGNFDAFAAKYHADGSLDWVRGLGGHISYGVALHEIGDETAADNIYVAVQDAVLDSGLVWKLNGDDGSHGGSPIWSDEGGSFMYLNDVAVDQATGDLALTGSFDGTLSSSNTVSGQTISVSSEGYSDAFVVKADSNGLVYWIEREGGRDGHSEGYAVAFDDGGDLYSTGRLTIGGGPKNERTNSGDIHIWKLDANGSEQWQQRAGGDGWDEGFEIVTHGGDVYVAGSLAESDAPAEFGHLELPVLASDILSDYGFVTKLDDSTGEFLWVSGFGSNEASSRHDAGSIDFDSAGQLYLAGRSTTAGTFGALQLAAPTGPSWGFLATMDENSGAFETVQRIGTSTDSGRDLFAIDSSDNLIMGGYLEGNNQEFLTGDVLSSTPDANGNPSYDAILVKLFGDDPTNTAPTADAGGPYVGAEDATITFDALLSDDVDGNALSYSWDFGDGATAVTASPTVDHAFQWGDTFTVSVTVSDGRGGSDTATTTATVSEVNDAPVADAGGPYSGVENEAVTFDASASTDFDNVDGTTANDQALTYRWDFDDDGTIDAVTSNPTVDHAYATAGTYNVRLTVDDGIQTVSDIAVVTISEPPAGIEIYIADIRFDSRARDRDWRAVVEIRDVDGNAVSGVNLKVDFAGTTYELTTDSNGIARTSWVRNLANGDYYADAYDLALAGYFWDPFAFDLEDDSDGDGKPDDLLTV